MSAGGAEFAETTVRKLYAEGRLTAADVAAVEQFCAFLRAAAAFRTAPGRGLTGIPTSVVREHAAGLGLSDADVDDLARRRGES